MPREFGCFLLFVVYVPPSGKASQAASTIADCVHELQLKYPDAPAIVLGDLNQCRLETVLPGFEQYVKDQTRKDNILDKCFVNVKGAYVSKCRPPILNSDHNVVHMIPVYKTKLKRSKPEKKVIRTWTNESREQLKACFDWTNWEIFREDSLDEMTRVTNDYINFCVQLVVPTKEIKIYPNNKSYVTRDIKKVINTRKVAFKDKDFGALKQTEKIINNSVKCTDILDTVIPATSDRIIITVEDVRKIFQRTNTKKAAGPDECSAFLLKNFATELAPVWQPVFQASVDKHTVPLSWKTSHIKPLPKISCPKGHKDFRPIALTSVIMKSLERILLQHLVSTTKDKLDPCQFAYKQGCGTEDAVVTLVHIISKHLNNPNTYVRALFLDFSSAFNTIQSDILVSKMVQLELNPYLIHWYVSFLTNRV